MAFKVYFTFGEHCNYDNGAHACKLLFCFRSIVSPKTKKLDKVGEAFAEAHNPLVPAQWQVNDERASRRQLHYISPMFHFRHWDDFGSSGIATKWSTSGDEVVTSLPSCMVLRVDDKKIMRFETCDSVLVARSAAGQKKNLRQSH